MQAGIQWDEPTPHSFPSLPTSSYRRAGRHGPPGGPPFLPAKGQMEIIPTSHSRPPQGQHSLCCVSHEGIRMHPPHGLEGMPAGAPGSGSPQHRRLGVSTKEAPAHLAWTPGPPQLDTEFPPGRLNLSNVDTALTKSSPIDSFYCCPWPQTHHLSTGRAALGEGLQAG